MALMDEACLNVGNTTDQVSVLKTFFSSLLPRVFVLGTRFQAGLTFVIKAGDYPKLRVTLQNAFTGQANHPNMLKL
jgi:hypothetical protein